MYVPFFHYSTPPTPLDLCHTYILSSPEHSYFPHHAIIVVTFTTTATKGWHTCSKVCWARKYVRSRIPLLNTSHTPWSLPHVHPYFARAPPLSWPCYIFVTFTTTAPKGWHTCSKVCWARKYVRSLFPLLNTSHPPWFCITSILSSPEHYHAPDHAIIAVHSSSTAPTRWQSCSKVCWARKYVRSLFPLFSTSHTPWFCITSILFFTRAPSLSWSC